RASERSGQADGDGMALVLPRLEPAHRLGRADGGLVADGDPGRGLLPARPAAHRVRPDRGGGARVSELERLAAACVFPSFPGGEVLGVIDDVEVTEAVAASIGAELAAAGVNWDFAPVADVNVPANPVIGTRAFGDDAALVARHVAAWTRGLQSRQVAACAKH